MYFFSGLFFANPDTEAGKIFCGLSFFHLSRSEATQPRGCLEWCWNSCALPCNSSADSFSLLSFKKTNLFLSSTRIATKWANHVDFGTEALHSSPVYAWSNLLEAFPGCWSASCVSRGVILGSLTGRLVTRNAQKGAGSGFPTGEDGHPYLWYVLLWASVWHPHPVWVSLKCQVVAYVTCWAVKAHGITCWEFS